MSSAPLPLAGYRVVDYSHFIAGPFLSRCLAALGAEVIKVERPTAGDPGRAHPYFIGGQSGYYLQQNMGKRGLCVNLRDARGRELMQKLADSADVFVENYRPGTMGRLGLGYADLSARNPGLVYCSISANGHTGLGAAQAGYGLIAEASSDSLVRPFEPGAPPPLSSPAQLWLYARTQWRRAVCAALLGRAKSGRGQHIDLAQVEAAMHFIEPVVLDYTVNGRVAPAAGHESPYASPYGVYHTDGLEEYVALSCETPEQWRALLAVAPLGDFAGPEFDNLAARMAHDGAIDAVLERWCAGFEAHALAAKLKAAGVPASVVLRPSELYEDAQLAHRDFFKWLDHTVMGPTPYDGPVTLFSATPPQYTAAPCLGEHTEYVLRDLLGMSDDEIVAYAEQGSFA